MAEPYNVELKKKICLAVELGASRREVASAYCVSIATVGRYVRQSKSGGALDVKKRGRNPGKYVEIRELKRDLIKIAGQIPGATLKEIQKGLLELTGREFSLVHLREAMIEFGIEKPSGRSSRKYRYLATQLATLEQLISQNDGCSTADLLEHLRINEKLDVPRSTLTYHLRMHGFGCQKRGRDNFWLARGG